MNEKGLDCDYDKRFRNALQCRVNAMRFFEAFYC
jgi:hypothetical protein